MSAPLIVIFGAAVTPDGRPSPALVRRIAYGAAAAKAHPDAPILCSGGAAGFGESEASVMARLLVERGVAAERLILDEASANTRSNVEAAWRRVRAGGHPFVVACSDGYHLPRIRLLFIALGVASVSGPVSRAAERPPLGHRIGMALREALAIPHSLALLLAKRRRTVS